MDIGRGNGDYTRCCCVFEFFCNCARTNVNKCRSLIGILSLITGQKIRKPKSNTETKTETSKRERNETKWAQKAKGHANALLARQSAAITLQFILCVDFFGGHHRGLLVLPRTERSKFVNVS